MNRILIIILVSCFFCSCRNDKQEKSFDSEFTKKYKLTSEQLLDSNFIWGRPFYIHYSDSSILVYDDLNDSIFTLVDLNDHKTYRFGRKGEGRDEFIQVASFHNLSSDSLIGVYDTFKHVLVKMNLLQMKKGNINFPLIVKDSLNSVDVCPTKYDTYIGLGFYEKNMLSLFAKEAEKQYFFEYPYKDKREKAISNRLRGLAYQGFFCSNRSLDKFVFAVRSAPIFFLYSIKNNKIVETYKWVGGYPIYKTEENGKMYAAPMSIRNLMCFVDAYATNKYVYLLYSGKTFEKAGMAVFGGSTIYQLTWEGMPVCKFELDVPITQFCVSDADNVIYAFSNKNDISLVKFLLNSKHV